MPDLIDAQITEIIDGETIRLRIIGSDPRNAHRYELSELLRVIDSPAELKHQEPRDDVGTALHQAWRGELVRCQVETRGTDGVLIGEVRRLHNQ